MHPEEDKIIKYIWHDLAEEEEMRIGEHLAECEACVKTAQTEAQFLHLWENWQAQTHGEIFWQKFIKRTMHRTYESMQCGFIKDRLADWLKLWHYRLGSMIQCIESGAKELAEVITEFPREILSASGNLHFAPVAPVRGTTQSHTLKIQAKENIQVQLLLDDTNSQLLVRIPDTFTNPPLIILAPKNGAPVAAYPEKVAGTAWYSVTFTDIPPGGWVLLFEPVNPRI